MSRGGELSWQLQLDLNNPRGDSAERPVYDERDVAWLRAKLDDFYPDCEVELRGGQLQISLRATEDSVSRFVLYAVLRVLDERGPRAEVRATTPQGVLMIEPLAPTRFRVGR